MLPNYIYRRLSPLFVNTAFGQVADKKPKYYYEKWIKHLYYAQKNGFKNKILTIAEFGPGDSLGLGLCALLSGASRYYAFDVIKHATNQQNIHTLSILANLFKENAAVNMEVVDHGVKKNVVLMPSDFFVKKELDEFIKKERVESIAKALVEGKCADIEISYIVPWDDFSLVEDGSVDFLISNAVMEHVDDLEFAYDACAKWLKNGGCMSHGIDFRCHGTANRWNGHWTYSTTQWNVIRNNRTYLLNREPYSRHKQLMESKGFEVITEVKRSDFTGISRDDLAEKFRELSETDLTTSGMLVQAIRN